MPRYSRLSVIRDREREALFDVLQELHELGALQHAKKRLLVVVSKIASHRARSGYNNGFIAGRRGSEKKFVEAPEEDFMP